MYKVNNKDNSNFEKCFTPYSSVSIVKFEHVIAGLEEDLKISSKYICLVVVNIFKIRSSHFTFIVAKGCFKFPL